ncbi:MAG: helicase-related protein [Bacillota bacterium]|nr:helicase-related protein [Bacillota bacterium]
MVGALYFVYVARTLREGDPPLVGVSHYPPVDLAVLAAEGYEHLTVVKGPLPLALAEREARRVAGRIKARFGAISAALGHPREAGATETQPGDPDPTASGLTRRAWWWLLPYLRSGLRPFGPRNCPPGSRVRDRHGRGGPASLRLHLGPSVRARSAAVTVLDCSAVEVPSGEELDAVRDVLEGRILFDHEIRRALEERGHPVAGPLEDVLQVLIVRGLVRRAPSVTIDRFGIATCARCGGRDIVEASCASCGSDECLRCVECASMGEARSCRPLYYTPGRAGTPGARHLGAAGLRPTAASAATGTAFGIATWAFRRPPMKTAAGRATGAAPTTEFGAAPGAAVKAAVVSPVSGLVSVPFAAHAGARLRALTPAAHPAHLDLPEHEEYPKGPERPESPQRPEHPERPECPERPDRECPERPERPEGPECLVRPESRALPGNPVPAWEITLPFELTKAQQDASRFLASFVAEDERNECLVYAVCGAGKTEVCLGAVALTLQRGGRVLFAVPRSDVVAEVAPRLSAAMTGARVIALRGASRERYRDADIVVATTHQVLRFYQAFDLVVLDEADAFPFRGSRMLRYGLRRATAPGGKTVYMTATPDQSLLAAADRGEVALVRISARHHGRPLPVPAVIKATLPPIEDHAALSTLRRPRTGPGLPPEVVAVIAASIRAGHGVFVFVPTVDLARRVCAMLRVSLTSPTCSNSPNSVSSPISLSSLNSPNSVACDVYPACPVSHGSDGFPGSHGFDGLHASHGASTAAADSAVLPGSAASPACPPGRHGSPLFPAAARPRVAFVHSRHPERDRVREAFKEGQIDVLVTTTIMERGITVPMADVVVLYADFERVFDAGTLVQMAGRAGRSHEYPCAQVYFVAERTSPAMRAAIASIRAMNEHAAKSGYLLKDDDSRL